MNAVRRDAGDGGKAGGDDAPALMIRDQRQLGAAIRRLRRDAGMSQQALADRAGIRQPTLSELESGKMAGRLDTILRVLAALDLDMTLQPRRRNSRDSDIGNIF